MGKTFNTGRLGNGLFVDANGNVGIGTTSPSELLHLYKSGTVYQIIQTVSGGAGTVYRRSNSTTPDWTIGHGAASANENFEVYTSGTGAFTWTMNGSERVRITSAGKVGIGQTSPSYILDVSTSNSNSVFAATTTFAHSGGYLDHSAFLAPNMTGGALSVSFGKSASNYNTGKFVFNYAGDGSTSNSIGLGFYNADNLLVVRGNGHIGIGTTSPAAQLHMYNAGGTVRMRMETGSTGAALLDFYNSTTARWSIGIDNNQSYGKLENRVLATDAIRFYDSSNNVVLVPSSGLVGIGATSPSARLHIVGASGNGNTLRLDSYDNAGDNWVGFYQNNGTRVGYLGYGYSASNIMEIFQEANEPFIISTNALERMRILANGNIGIGMTSPGYKLEVWNTTHNVFRVVNTGSANGNSPTAQFLNSYGNHSWGITAEFRVGASGGEDRPSILFSNGFDNNTWACGFGYADSSYFRINKDQGPYSGSWGVTLFSLDRSGNYSFAGSNVSDRRNKKDIVYISDSQLDTILKLKPATFVKKSPGKEEYSEHTHTGFIAQDILEDNIPNLVHGSEEKGYGLDYDGILALAVKAIQELKAEIEILKNK